MQTWCGIDVDMLVKLSHTHTVEVCNSIFNHKPEGSLINRTVYWLAMTFTMETVTGSSIGCRSARYTLWKYISDSDLMEHVLDVY